MNRPAHNSNRSVRWIDQFARDVDGLGAEIAKLHRAHRAKSPAAPRSGEVFRPRLIDRTVPANIKLYGMSISEPIFSNWYQRRFKGEPGYRLCGTPPRWHRIKETP
jgi:hypothetical protein